MAPYTMCHLKVEMLLKDTGYVSKNKLHTKRLKVFLTNSLEEVHPESGTLFASWLSREATAANHVKDNTPVMVVIGNPPYSGESANKGSWIMELMEDYKKEPGGIEKLKERNPKWINDDYMKFIRYGQHYIEKNGAGVLAFINPHGFLDNPTFRGVRWNLLKTYDKIYTIDLHGNSKKKEKSPDGSPDENVFDIQQGVSINLFVKTGKKKENELGKVLHYDCYGKRIEKYNFLWENSIKSISYVELPNIKPNYFFMQKDFEAESQYNKGFLLVKLFPINNVGIVTSRDSFVIDDNKENLETRINNFFVMEKDQIQRQYDLKENKRWKITDVKKRAKGYNSKFIQKVNYRPFDERYIYYEDNFIERSRKEVMQHFLKGENVGLMTCRQTVIDSWEHIGITKLIADDSRVSNRSRERGYVFPLYLYPDSDADILSLEKDRTPNLNQDIVNQISEIIEVAFINNKEETEGTFAPIDILDYIYAILHSPSYREKYKEFLKIDFPRVPYPENTKTFWKLVKLGGELRQIHLLESPKVKDYITSYPIDGGNIVEKIKYEEGKVWINNNQFFDKVPEIAWNFYIGGYQPAQKWLKDRKGRELSVDDIFHYQKIIVVLTETDRIMKKIDDVI